jgi:hypothetical protein
MFKRQKKLKIKFLNFGTILITEAGYSSPKSWMASLPVVIGDFFGIWRLAFGIFPS